jgi:hypothetical protein
MPFGVLRHFDRLGVGVICADEFIVSVHAKFMGVADAHLPSFGFDSKLIHYQFLGYFKLGAALLVFIPLLVLRLSRSPALEGSSMVESNARRLS